MRGFALFRFHSGARRSAAASVVANRQAPRPLTSDEIKMLRAVKRNSHSTFKKLAELTGVNTKNIFRILSELRGRGLMEWEPHKTGGGAGGRCLTHEGHEAAREG